MTPDETLVDNPERQRIRTDLNATLFVEAAAGTGKTSELIARIVALLCTGRTVAGEPVSLADIVALTFTEKAAGEMKLRLRGEIETERARGTADVRARLDKALESLELARIGTIHAFCGDVLRERPIEAGVDPLFEVVDETAASALLDRAFDEWFDRVLADPPEGIRRLLRRRPRDREGQTPREALRAAAGVLVEHRDFPTAWRRDRAERQALIDRTLQRLGEVAGLADRASWSGDYLAQSLAEIARFVRENALRESVRGRDYDALEAELRDVLRWRSWRWRGSPHRPYGPELPRADVLAQRDGVHAEVQRVCEQLDGDLAPLLREELRPVVAAYETLKHRSGKLDFIDLLLCTRDLIVRDGQVRTKLQERFTHYFVDEFQDTDPLQAEILLLLASQDPAETDWERVRPVPGKLFVVGDPKQSIYRFRRADVAIYEKVKRQLAGRGADVLQLRTSFRSVPSLQAAVNAAFAPLMQECPDGSQAGYVPLEPIRDEVSGQPSLVALPVPRPYTDYGNRAQIEYQRIEESLPDAVGAFIEWLIRHSGWTVTERDKPTERMRLQPRHVCVLFRRLKRFRDDMTRLYVRALEVRQIPHVLVGGRSFHDREEVLAIRNALHAIEWPDDELRVFATLRGPLLALGDDVLLAYRQKFRSLHPMRRHEPAELSPADAEVAAALAILGQLHVGRNRRPIAETIARLLAAVRAHAGLAIWPTGEQALANCLRVLDLARRFERGGAVSFRAFVECMEAEADSGTVEEAPAVEEGTEGVRIMSVHRAKGLEFPVVVLADPTCNAVREPPTRHVDAARRLWLEPLCGCAPPELREAYTDELQRDRAEAVRLVYVAATRARDVLVVPVIGDKDGTDDGGWLAALNPSLYPAPAARRSPQPAPACPRFGNDSVLTRPQAVQHLAGEAVAPGCHLSQAGTHHVVWWDPHVLELDREQSVGLRQQRILEADEGGATSDAGAQAHQRWQAEHRERLTRGAIESVRLITVTDLAERVGTAPAADAIDLLELVADRRMRPHGKRFGALVHATLAIVDLDADQGTIESTAAAQARLLGATADEVQAAVTVVAAALAHPLMQRAQAAAQRGACRRETSITLRQPDGTIVEGVVDLAFREDDAWTVVDFKTDRELGKDVDAYRRQVGLYAAAITAATGKPATAVLFRL
jgi:ATP-dependent exoDNAse (exonuclease V) beta subunit